VAAKFSSLEEEPEIDLAQFAGVLREGFTQGKSSR